MIKYFQSFFIFTDFINIEIRKAKFETKVCS